MDENTYQTKVRNTAILVVYLILMRKDGRILVALRQGTGYLDGMWELPAGHVDEGELPVEALIRETKEEIGVILSRFEPALVHTSFRPVHDKTGNRIDLVFRVFQTNPKPVVNEPDKCAGHNWVLPTNLPQNMVPHVREFITYWVQKKSYSEFDVEWLKENGLYKL